MRSTRCSLIRRAATPPEPRTTTAFLVSALIRGAEADGGFGMVLAKGDPTSGGVILVVLRRGEPQQLLERASDHEGQAIWRPCGPALPAEGDVVSGYVERRRRSDPDIWAVELDLPETDGILDALIRG